MSRLLLCLVLLLITPPALAWSALGHRLIGELAWRHLDPDTAAQVRLLLDGEPDPTLGGVATWADTLRQSDPERFRATGTWHYLDTPRGTCDYQPARDCPNGDCVVGAIEAQRKILGDRTQPLQARRDALKFLVHFVGDVHQPMHANNQGDKGGNAYQISLRTDLKPEAYARKHYVDGVMGTNLHSIWDYYILGTADMQTAPGTEAPSRKPVVPELSRYADRLAALPWPPKADSLSPPSAWAHESCELVGSRHLYPAGHKLDQDYLDAQRPLAEQRLRQAAYRLAILLDDTLGQQ